MFAKFIFFLYYACMDDNLSRIFTQLFKYYLPHGYYGFSSPFHLLLTLCTYLLVSVTGLSPAVDRPVTCKYSRIGCPWRGPAHELPAHQTQCVHPHNTGDTIMGVLQASELRRQRDAQLYDTIFDLLSFEKILFNGGWALGGGVGGRAMEYKRPLVSSGGAASGVWIWIV